MGRGGMPKKGGKAAKKAEEMARKAEEERLAAIAEAERLERERQEMEEEQRRLAEEKKMVIIVSLLLSFPFPIALLACLPLPPPPLQHPHRSALSSHLPLSDISLMPSSRTQTFISRALSILICSIPLRGQAPRCVEREGEGEGEGEGESSTPRPEKTTTTLPRRHPPSRNPKPCIPDPESRLCSGSRWRHSACRTRRRRQSLPWPREQGTKQFRTLGFGAWGLGFMVEGGKAAAEPAMADGAGH
jgi:hypothetical protein